MVIVHLRRLLIEKIPFIPNVWGVANLCVNSLDTPMHTAITSTGSSIGKRILVFNVKKKKRKVTITNEIVYLYRKEITVIFCEATERAHIGCALMLLACWGNWLIRVGICMPNLWCSACGMMPASYNGSAHWSPSCLQWQHVGHGLGLSTKLQVIGMSMIDAFRTS